MPVLELAIDATKVTQGARQAEQALDQTATKARRAEVAVKSVGKSASVTGNDLNAAFAATSGGLGVTRGLVSMTDGLRRADGAMAGFAASQALLDLGRFGADMRTVAGATGATGGAFSKLGAIIKANPLLTIAGVLAGAATVMGLFKDETEETATAWDRLAESVKSANLSALAAEGLGAGGAAQKRAGAAASVYEQFVSDPRRRTTGRELSGLLGLTPRKFEEYLEQDGFGTIRDFRSQFTNIEATSIIRTVYKDLMAKVAEEAKRIRPSSVSGGATATAARGLAGSLFGGGINGAGTVLQTPRERELQDLYGRRSEEIGLQQFHLRSRQRSALGPGEGPLSGAAYASPFLQSPGSFGAGTVRQSPEQRAQIDEDVLNRNTELANQRMDELVRKGEQFGATMGDAFFNVATGATTARQAIAAIVADLARATSRQAFSALFGQVAAGFGQTGAQAAANQPSPGSNIQLPT